MPKIVCYSSHGLNNEPFNHPTVLDHLNTELPWGSEIQNSLDFKWLIIGWVANCPVFALDLKSGSPTIWNREKCLPVCQRPFEIWTKTSRFWMVQFSNGWDSSCCLKSDIPNVRISNVSEFWMFGIQIPTVVRFSDPDCIDYQILFQFWIKESPNKRGFVILNKSVLDHLP